MLAALFAYTYMHAYAHNNDLIYNAPILGGDIHNIVIITSETPLVADLTLPTNLPLLISTFDPMGARIRTTLNITLSKCSYYSLMLFLT